MEYKEGLSLAQMPTYLRKRLSFVIDLEYLGFKKFKDLLLSLTDPQVKIIHKGQNHPFAILGDKKPDEEQKV